MQVEVIEKKEPKEFRPITLQVTIETREELFSLYRRLSLTMTEVDLYFDEAEDATKTKEELFELYRVVNVFRTREGIQSGN